MRCFTVLGPSGSGKTTLVEALSQLDSKPVKSELTEFFSLTEFTFLDEPWCAFDVAGGSDFLGYAGEALAASDAAILCVPPDPEAAVLCAPYLRLAEESGTPCVLFINRMDTTDNRVRDIVSGLQAYANHTIILRQVPIRREGEVVGAVDLISERAWQYQPGTHSRLIEMPAAAQEREQEARAELLEHLSDFDDHLLEELIEDKEPPSEEVYEVAAAVLRENEDIPAFLGSASAKNGITRLMKSLRHDAPSVGTTAERMGKDVLAVGVFASFRKHMGKAVVLRAMDADLDAGATLGGASIGNLSGIDAKHSVTSIPKGAVGVAVKSDHLDAGYLYTSADKMEMEGWTRGHPPSHATLLTPVHEKDDARLSSALARLAETDPGLRVEQDEASGHAILRLQGPMHLRRVQASLESDFGVQVEAAPVSASYRETITKKVDHQHRHRKQSGGAGQFADVHITIAPRNRGDGFAFDEVVKGGAVPRNYIPAVEAGARDAMQQGPLGFPVIDVAVTLTDGKAHSVDSSDFAFRAAGKACVKDALGKAGPTLLQPVDQVNIHVPSTFSGSIVTLVSSLKGQVLGFDPNPDAKGWDIFHALLPESSLDELSRALGGAAQGTAWFEAGFDHYQEVHGKEAERISAEAKEEMA
ncbi:elongation factor G [Tropicimonas isoalkanivorans]|uniref:Elongation factor G n=1 Tax=Tropicimonas isoalkanivorans TaxID=441112 RepID=A0A1I1Q2V1_9RHOB|nr:elongation factor G [Tropicimonas isoalkanivorans]SFD13553.1 elongation factor G [Tropicimonas isoalkanivorans]